MSIIQENRCKAEEFLIAVRTFADNALEHGICVFGPRKTPLFVDGINIDTHEPVKWKTGDMEWAISNLASQQVFFRTLDGLTILTGDQKYKEAALAAIRFAFNNMMWTDKGKELPLPAAHDGAVLLWGGHLSYDATNDCPATTAGSGDDVFCYEMKNSYPYYQLFWEADPVKTEGLIKSIWNALVINWRTLAIGRHGWPKENATAVWEHEYEPIPPFYEGDNCTFLCTGADLYYSAGILASLNGKDEPLEWAKRMMNTYAATRRPGIGISGYSYTVRKVSIWGGDPFKETMEQDFPGRLVAECTLFKNPNQMVRPVMAALLLGLQLGERGADFLQFGVDELKAWGKHAYRASENAFVPMMLDGTPLEGYVIPIDGIYKLKGYQFKPIPATYLDFWAYTLAYRLSGDPFLWEMVANMEKGLKLEDLEYISDHSDDSTYVLSAFLELFEKTEQSKYLDSAIRVGNSILNTKFNKGYFTRGKEYPWADFNATEPYALLRLAATLTGKKNQIPVYVPEKATYHAIYGSIEDRQYKDILFDRKR